MHREVSEFLAALHQACERGKVIGLDKLFVDGVNRQELLFGVYRDVAAWAKFDENLAELDREPKPLPEGWDQDWERAQGLLLAEGLLEAEDCGLSPENVRRMQHLNAKQFDSARGRIVRADPGGANGAFEEFIRFQRFKGEFTETQLDAIWSHAG